RRGDGPLRRCRHPGQQRRRPDRAQAAARDERRALRGGDGRERAERLPDVPGGGARHGGAQARRRRQHGVARGGGRRRAGGGPGAGAYAAAKGAVVSLTKALAKELAPHGIRVNCVAPGLIGDTAFHGRFTPPAAFHTAEKGVLLGRAGTPDEVASVVAFLASG